VFDACTFDRLDGNGVMVSGYNRNTTVSNSDFSFIGGNAIASWGYVLVPSAHPGFLAGPHTLRGAESAVPAEAHSGAAAGAAGGLLWQVHQRDGIRSGPAGRRDRELAASRRGRDGWRAPALHDRDGLFGPRGRALREAELVLCPGRSAPDDRSGLPWLGSILAPGGRRCAMYARSCAHVGPCSLNVHAMYARVLACARATRRIQAKTSESKILGNVFFNGPRAGINANDGFGGAARRAALIG
jgi:hypothetical protein